LAIQEQVAKESDWATVADAPVARQTALRLLPPTERPTRQLVASSQAYQLGKRCLDLAVALLLLVLLVPVLLVAAVTIRLESRGPALFRQWRLGRNGRPFRIFKLRTLTVVEDGAITQVTRNDPRLTRIGGIFRKLSIDELPQLINVIRGEMSLVGPRPHAVAHDHYYAERIDSYTLRQSVKPGITGWAQIHGFRGETAALDDMRQRVHLDIWYVRHASLLVDLRILLATPRAVFRGRNAW
jgi:putative colanic acid biosynthesis UDP-glucose lipid carrier transferase